MKLSALLGLISLFGSYQVIAQPLAIERYYEGIYDRFTPIIDIRLFDPKEIAARSFDSVFIIRHPSSWEPGHPNACSFSDTLFLYCFDAKGRKTEYRNYYGGTTVRYDSTGKTISLMLGTRIFPADPGDTSKWKRVVKKEMSGADTIIKTIDLCITDNRWDTCSTISTTRDKHGRTIEISQHTSEQYKKETYDHLDESTYRYQYRYDSAGRIIYFLSNDYKNEPSISQTISYPSYGQVIETRTALTNRLIDTEVLLISENKGIITITNQSSQVTLVPIEKGSKLFKLKTVSTSGEHPYIEHFEISYR